MAAKTRRKAPARWAMLLVSGLASAGFLWGIVNTPGSAGVSTSAASNSAVVAAPTPAAYQQPVGQRIARGDDGGGITSLILPSSQAPTTVQPSQTTQPLASTGRFRTRGS